MIRAWLVVGIALAGVAGGLLGQNKALEAQKKAVPQWIWFDEGDPAQKAPAETRYFRKVFRLPGQPRGAVLEITADNQFTVWINGVEIGQGDDWKRLQRFEVKSQLFLAGDNVVAVKAHNTEGPAGLVARLEYATGKAKSAVVSDGSWKASKTAAKGWENTDFNDRQWSTVKVLGPLGTTAPWNQVVAASPQSGAGGERRFTVPSGFVVEKAAQNPEPKDPFSLVNMTFDNKGRLLVSKENGPVLLCTQPDQNGVCQSVKPYCDRVRNCQGMCWVRDALLLVGNGPQGTGLYRVTASASQDKTDKTELLHKFAGGMGEHGPHAILHGPDDWLYLVIGNHAGARPDHLAANSPLTRWPTGQMGPDQGKPGTTEDVLLPRQNDARGHAANILAPGGTIWRLDHQGKNMSLVTAGFRNHFDAAFSPNAELFTFDSDMEWDVGLPWYRAVRVCHCPPGADFLWRTGAANTPDYYLDSLPPLMETGRGSPVGLEFYDHDVFPEKYRGAYFMADWSLGLIYALHLQRDGATYKGQLERFCAGNPMNVTDIGVGPDGALYFTMGGRGSQGGVYRIVYRGATAPKRELTEADPSIKAAQERVLLPQPLAGWSREKVKVPGKQALVAAQLERMALTGENLPPGDAASATKYRIRALNLLAGKQLAERVELKLLLALAQDRNPDLRAHAVWLLGVYGYPEGRAALVKALKDPDALIRRRACEALVRANLVPPLDSVWPLLDDRDRFVRTAARLVVQRMEPKQWVAKLWTESNRHTVLEGIVALCKINRALPYTESILKRLRTLEPGAEAQDLLDYLRTVQLALIHTDMPHGEVISAIAERCVEMFPHVDWRVNRELAILLAHFGSHGDLKEPVHGKLLSALLAEKDRAQQIHYDYCLRLLKKGWTAEQKTAWLTWYDSTKTWTGGESFAGFLYNILRDANDIFTPEERRAAIAKGDQHPLAASAMLRLAPTQVPPPAVLAETYARLTKTNQPAPQSQDLKKLIVEALGRGLQPEAQAALRRIGDNDPDQLGVVAQSLARFPTADNWPYLVRGLDSSSKLVVSDLIDALTKAPSKPKPDNPAPFRALLLATTRLDQRDRWRAVELLRHWTDNKQFGAEKGDWKAELTAWSRWFGQSFPKEPALPNAVAQQRTESKYKFAELLDFLEKDPAGMKGDAERGRLAFDKAQCLKCHKFGKVGEGIGPDLTTVAKRFKRVDILDSIVYPSKVISDQYRSTLFVTANGKQIIGLAAPMGDTITVLVSDGSKVVLKKEDIDQQFASLVSVMPEKLLDLLSKREIADLFAYLESEPTK